MTILVAGGAGFIGSHLIDQLLMQGHKIICADKLVYNNMENIKHHLDNKNFIFEKADLSKQDNSDQLFDSYKINTVYHLAANSDIQKSGKEPGIDFTDTLLTTHCLLESMRKYNSKCLFFASTSAVYGDKNKELLKENTGDLMPLSYYGGAKLASEALISSYVAMCNIKALVFRFPNVVGPRLTHGVIYDFIKKLKANPEVLEILGNGTQCKPYIYVTDLIAAILQQTASWSEGMSVYNISSLGEGTTVTGIAEMVVKKMALYNARFHYTGGDRGWKGDVPKFQYDISRILETGWHPTYSSDAAVEKTIEDVLG